MPMPNAGSHSTFSSNAISVPGSRQTATCGSPTAAKPRVMELLNLVVTSLSSIWAGRGFASPFLLPSQDTPNFYNAKMCRDRQVLSALKTAATNTLKTKVIVAGGDGPTWSGYQPHDIHLEAISILSKDKSAIFCSV